MAQIDPYFDILEKMRGSDLHLRCGSPPLIRILGAVSPLNAEPLPPPTLERLLFEIMPADSRKEFDAAGEADFAYSLPNGKRLRCNVFRERLGVGGAFRIIPSVVPSAKDVYLTQPILQLCENSKGLVLVTGPTGSGKSTTMAAMIDKINESRQAHIVTIEDPIEFVHKNKRCLITQREVGSHTRSFASALRAALREDPDVVLVGEMRDLETAMIAIETAETGHLVFGTLHTTEAASTVDRLIDQFPADRQDQIRTMLASSLTGVVSQSLLRTADGKGMVAAREILLVTSAIRNLIREKKTYQIASEIQTGTASGMMPLNEAIFRFVKAGVVSKEEALYQCIDKEDMKRRFLSLPAPVIQYPSGA